MNVTSEVIRRRGFNAAVLCFRPCPDLLGLLFGASLRSLRFRILGDWSKIKALPQRAPRKARRTLRIPKPFEKVVEVESGLSADVFRREPAKSPQLPGHFFYKRRFVTPAPVWYRRQEGRIGFDEHAFERNL